jgi:outer membrane protein assembly factor BamB
VEYVREPRARPLNFFNARIKWCFIRMNRPSVVATVVCIIFLSSLVLIPFAKADWTMFRSDPSHSGTGTGNPALTPTLLWIYTHAPATVDSSPAVANGVIYTGSYDGNVYALNATSGAKLWSYTTGFGVDSSPAVADGVVYIASYHGYVYALGGSSTSTPTPTSTSTPTSMPTPTSPAFVFSPVDWLIVIVVVVIVLILIILAGYGRRKPKTQQTQTI